MTQEEKNRQDPEVAEYCERKEIKRKYVNISYANYILYCNISTILRQVFLLSEKQKNRRFSRRPSFCFLEFLIF